jgi:hypothetical protein
LAVPGATVTATNPAQGVSQATTIALNGRNLTDLFKTIPGVVAGGTITTSAGAGFIALTTRGGTNEYRGGLRYFKRDEKWNANSYFNTANNRPRPFYSYDYYGWDFGGPVPFVGSKENPKLFFLAQEYYEQQTPAANPTNTRVPTEAERHGDFSQTRDGNGNFVIIHDPLTGLPFPGNVIPASRFAPGMEALMGVYPLPNAPEGGALYNYTSQLPRDIPRREDIARIDWQIARGTRLSARYIHNKDEDVQPLGTTTAAFNFRLAENDVVRKNGLRRDLLAHAQPRVQLLADQRVRLRGRARRGLHRPRRARRRDAFTLRRDDAAPVPGRRSQRHDPERSLPGNP